MGDLELRLLYSGCLVCFYFGDCLHLCIVVIVCFIIFCVVCIITCDDVVCIRCVLLACLCYVR